DARSSIRVCRTNISNATTCLWMSPNKINNEWTFGQVEISGDEGGKFRIHSEKPLLYLTTDSLTQRLYQTQKKARENVVITIALKIFIFPRCIPIRPQTVPSRFSYSFNRSWCIKGSLNYRTYLYPLRSRKAMSLLGIQG
ncbi:hypothetical protein AC249_AIPGENE12552, partial [Exaiptasia diaphana]